MGKVVRMFSKSSNKPIAEAAKKVLDCWKGAVKSESKPAAPAPTPAPAGAPEPIAEDRAKAEPATTSKPEEAGPRGASAPAAPPKPVAKHELKATGDERRDRYINTIADLLAMESSRVEGGNAGKVAVEASPETSAPISGISIGFLHFPRGAD